MAIPTLKERIYSCCEPKPVHNNRVMMLEAMMNVMQAAFVILQSSTSLDKDMETLSVGYEVFVTLFSSYFDKTDEEVKPACVCACFLFESFCIELT